jgi:hypothetical protein
VFPGIGGAIGFVDDPVAVVGPVVVLGGVVVGAVVVVVVGPVVVVVGGAVVVVGGPVVVVGEAIAVVGGAIAVVESTQRAMAAPDPPTRHSIVDPSLILRQRLRTEPPERLLPENHRRRHPRYRVQWDRS